MRTATNCRSWIFSPIRWTHDTIGKIGQLCSSRVDIIGHDSVVTYRNSRKPLHQIGNELGVDYILQGSVIRDADKIRINAEFIRTSDQVTLWTFDDARVLGDISETQNQIIGKIAESLGVTIAAADIDAMNRASTENSEARESYLHAVEDCENGTDRGLKDCVSLLDKALKADPRYPRAHVLLADAQLRSGLPYQTAEDHIRQALLTTDAIPEAHFVWGDILYKFHNDDKTADEEFRKAIELRPEAKRMRSLRYTEFLLQKKRIEDAQAQVSRALALDPDRVDANIMDGRVLIAAQSYDRAIERLGDAVGLDRSSPEIRYYLGEAYLSRSMYADAVRELEKAVSVWPSSSPEIWRWRWRQLGKQPEPLSRVRDQARRDDWDSTPTPRQVQQGQNVQRYFIQRPHAVHIAMYAQSHKIRSQRQGLLAISIEAFADDFLPIIRPAGQSGAAFVADAIGVRTQTGGVIHRAAA